MFASKGFNKDGEAQVEVFASELASSPDYFLLFITMLP